MKEFTEEYGFVDSGIFALALSEALHVDVVVLYAHKFIIHVCCRYEQYYLDASGVSTQKELIHRVARDYHPKDMLLQCVSHPFVVTLSEFQPDELVRAQSAVKRYLAKVSLPEGLNERRLCVQI